MLSLKYIRSQAIRIKMEINKTRVEKFEVDHHGMLTQEWVLKRSDGEPSDNRFSIFSLLIAIGFRIDCSFTV